MKAKLTDLLKTTFNEQYEKRSMITHQHTAEYLIANGVVVQEHGRWEEWWPGDIALIMTGEEMLYRCSVCDAKYPDVEAYRYCPHCGNPMDGEANGNG